MAPDTKDSIKKMVKGHMENPNSIILCIQGENLIDKICDPDIDRNVSILNILGKNDHGTRS